MDRIQHDEYVEAILAVEQEFDNLDLSDLSISKEEAQAIAERIPESTLRVIGDIIESCQPRTAVDVRYLVVMKLLALMATKALKPIGDAFTIGFNSPE